MKANVQGKGAIGALLRSRWQLVASALLLLLLAGCSLLVKPPVTGSVHLLLGNPSNATTSLLSPDNYLMEKPQYVLSYNNSKHIPNWVSWQLNASWLGTAPRSNNFRPDDALPLGWYRFVPGDYSGTGFDRGHMTPSGDRTNTPNNNSATFLMTNVLPQSKANNQGPWEQLESYCRNLAQQGKTLYIVAGSYGKKMVLKNQLVVPTHTWKVIAILSSKAEIQSVTPQTRVIGVVIPNIEGIREADWRMYRVSVDTIETATGYDFLSAVPESVQKVLESQVDRG